MVSGFDAVVDVRDDFGSESDPYATPKRRDSRCGYDATAADCTDNPSRDDGDGFDEREWFTMGEGNTNATE